jgi:acyl-CoA thioesterase
MEEMSLDELREYFAGDLFATECLGATLDEWSPGKAVCSMEILSRHLNGQGFLCGGVIMAIADFALAVCGNANQVPCCSVNHTVDMMSRVKGKRLIATATECESEHEGFSFYRIDIYDELGTYVSRMMASMCRTPQIDSWCVKGGKPADIQ